MDKVSPINREPKLKIQLAYERARLTGEPAFVTYNEAGWFLVIEAPPVTKSHWKVLPDGRTFAHIAEPGKTEYLYEELR